MVFLVQWVSFRIFEFLNKFSKFQILFFIDYFKGQHGHLSSGLHPAHAHMHGGWYTSGMGALGSSGGLQGGFSTAGSLGGGVVSHSQPYHHLGLNSMVSFFFFENLILTVN